MNFVKFPRTPFLTEHLRWLLLEYFYNVMELNFLGTSSSLEYCNITANIIRMLQVNIIRIIIRIPKDEMLYTRVDNLTREQALY